MSKTPQNSNGKGSADRVTNFAQFQDRFPKSMGRKFTRRPSNKALRRMEEKHEFEVGKHEEQDHEH